MEGSQLLQGVEVRAGFWVGEKMGEVGLKGEKEVAGTRKALFLLQPRFGTSGGRDLRSVTSFPEPRRVTTMVWSSFRLFSYQSPGLWGKGQDLGEDLWGHPKEVREEHIVLLILVLTE